MVEKLRISAPGRICLFGEHQDYLGLPVITAAINLRIEIQGLRRDDSRFNFDLPDINDRDSFTIERSLPYLRERDYLRSAVNVLLREGLAFKNGYDCVVRGTIPINSGTASSSALTVAWVKFLLTIAGDKRHNDPMAIAQLAHRAEVVEFREPGGMMDHCVSTLGGIQFISFDKGIDTEPLKINLGDFVLGDSLEPKDTKAILARVKEGVLRACNRLALKLKNFDIKSISLDEIKPFLRDLSSEEATLIEGAIINRNLTQEAKRLLLHREIDHEKLGQLLDSHQQVLRDNLQISTPKIERMLNAARKAGAMGGKINGSGGGGCMFVYSPIQQEQVAEAIEAAGGRAYIIHVDEGVREEKDR